MKEACKKGYYLKLKGILTLIYITEPITSSVAGGFCTSTIRHKRSELHYKYSEIPWCLVLRVCARQTIFTIIIKGNA